MHLLIESFFKKLFVDLRERNINSLTCCPTYLFTHWLIPVCSLTRDWTGNLGVSGWCSNQLSYPVYPLFKRRWLDTEDRTLARLELRTLISVTISQMNQIIVLLLIMLSGISTVTLWDSFAISGWVSVSLRFFLSQGLCGSLPIRLGFIFHLTSKISLFISKI